MIGQPVQFVPVLHPLCDPSSGLPMFMTQMPEMPPLLQPPIPVTVVPRPLAQSRVSTTGTTEIK